MVIRSLLPISMETMHGPKEPVFLIALRIMRHAMLSFGDHVPYLRVLAPRKDVQGTVYLWAEEASALVYVLAPSIVFNLALGH